MIRFLLFLLGKQGYEECKSCETLKLQLEIANLEKKELTSTLLGLLKPKVYEAPPTELKATLPQLTTWSRRKAVLEQRDREAARIQANSKVIGRSDSEISKLEGELGINEAEEEKEVAE